jgi:subtilisin family serine protease
MILGIRFTGFLFILFVIISVDLAGQPDHFVNRGERPPVDPDRVNESSIEPGKLLIKLMPGAEEFIDGKVLETNKGESVKTGIGALDDLNIEFGATRYRPLLSGLYDRNSKSLQNQERHRDWGFHLWYELEIDTKTNIIEAAKKYALADEIETAEPVYRKRLISPVANDDKVRYDYINKSGFPDDPYYAVDQWHFNNTGQTIWGQEGIPGIDISLEAAWEIETGNSNIIVAVFDDGLDFSHEDLSAHIWDGIGPEGEDTRADDHATHVSGTISAVTNNSTGVAGIAGGTGAGDGVRIMSLDILGGEHDLTDLELYVYAADNGAAISQNSWGYLEPDVYNQFALDGIDYFNTYGGGEALVGGGITIFAAGNDDDDGNWYPAYYSGAMAVASYDNRGIRSGFSNYGDWIDISAPGTGILSTTPGNNYSFFQGTSMACPHVSGVAALVLSNVYGILSPQNLWDLLIENVDDIYQYNTLEYEGKLGSGGLNAYEALMAAQSYLGMVAGPQSFIAEPASAGQIDLSWTKNATGDNVMVAWSDDGTFGTPVEGYAYSEGEIIEGGGTVIYRSDGNSFNHTGLDPETRYYYRAFSYDGSDNYSLGRNSSAVTERMKYAVNFTVTGQSDEPLENVMIIVTPGGGDLPEGEIKSTEMWGQGMSSYESQLIDKELKGTASADRGMPKSHHEEEGTWIHWDDGVISGAIGLNSPGLFYVASRWVPSDLASYEGLFIRRLLFYISDLPNGTTAMIWQGDDESSLTGVYIQEFTPVADSWVEVELIEPYKIDITKELWFGYEIDDPGNEVYSAGRDQSTDHNGKGNKVKLGPGGDWANLSDLGPTGDWAIRAFLIEPDTLYTDVAGEASIDAYSGAYYYTAAKEGYQEVAGSLMVDNNAVQVNIKLGGDLAQVPVVTTTAISDIAATTATSGGVVTDDGGAEVTARGVVWSIAQNPAIVDGEHDGFTEDGTGTGEYVSEITGLEPGTDYYVRAYATNSEGTSYGDEINFSTITEDPTAPDGSGTAEDPYLIASLDDLLWLAENPEQWDKYYRQIADIDASGTTSWNDGEGWISIGFSESTGTSPWDPCKTDESFTGIYDGNHKTITGLYINRPDVHYQGLFGCVLDASISNLGLINLDFTGGNCLGGLVGQNDNTDIYGCYTMGSITGDYQVGGLIGRNADAGNVSNSLSTADVSGGNNVGGLLGTHGGTVDNSYSRGSVTGNPTSSGGSGSYVGGLAGIVTGGAATIDNCYSTGEVNAPGSYVGGLVGRNDNTVTNSYWDTEASGIASSAGGVGLTTSQMTSPYSEDAYINWNFIDIWGDDTGRDINNGYPYLFSIEVDIINPFMSLWNKLRSAEEVENSEAGPGGTIVGTVNFDNDVRYGKGVTPNTGNAGSGVDFPSTVVDPDKGTVEMWARFYHSPVAYSYGVYGLVNVHHWSDNVMLFSWHNDGSLLNFNLRFNGTGRGVNLNGFSPPLDTPVHLACVWDREGIDDTGDYMQIYVNGSLVASGSTDNDWGTDNSSGNFRVAAPWDSDFGTDRYSVEDIKVWSYARTEFEDVSGVGLPEVITSPVTGVTSTTATSGGEVTDDGGAEVTARGVVWSTSEGPTTDNNEGFTEDGTGTGGYVSELTGLEPGTLYYIRAYATNTEGPAYGEEISFTTDLISELTVTFNVTEQDGTTVENARITIIPEVLDEIILYTDASGQAAFEAPAGNYSYIVVKEGYIDVSDVFVVEDIGLNIDVVLEPDIMLPSVSSSEVTVISSTTARSGGEVTDDGGAEVTARGVVWSTSEGPTTDNNEGFTEDGTGTGGYVSELTGLEPGTEYYVRAYATNSEGTSYGDELSFTTEVLESYIVTFNVSGQDFDPVGDAMITVIPQGGPNKGKSGKLLIGEEYNKEIVTFGEQQFGNIRISGRKASSPVTFQSSKETIGEWIHWDSGETHGTVGLISSGEFSIASRWEPSDLADYDGKYISAISFLPTSTDCDYTVRFWDASGNVLYSKLVDDIMVDSWNFVSLDSLYAIDASEELWFGLHLNQGGSFPAGIDDGPAVAGKGDLINGGDGWVSMFTGFGEEYNSNWNLQAYVTEAITLYTDVDGKASFEAPAGNYSYIVVKEGYIDVSDVFIVEDNGLNIDVVLEPDIMLPSVSSSEVTVISTTTARSGGEVTDDGGAEVTARGVVWSTSEGPTTDNNEGFTEDGTGTGGFNSELTGLTPDNRYFVRAYATNQEGTSYGEEIEFFASLFTLWNKLGSAEEVENSEVGPGGTVVGTVNFNNDVKYGKGLTPNTGNAQSGVDFPTTVVDPEKGTVEMWAKFHYTPVAYSYGVFGFINVHHWSHNVMLFSWHNDGSLLGFDLTFNGNTRGVNLDNFSPALDTPVHLACVWDREGIDGTGDYMQIYVNGLLVASNSTSNDWGTDNSSGNFRVAAPWDSDFGTDRYSVENIKVWSYARTEFGGVSGVGLPEVSASPFTGINVYPNPGNGIFNIVHEGGILEDLSMEVISITGNVVYTREFKVTDSLNETIDLRDAGSGIYILRIREKDKVALKRLVFL